jgi:hypothetical protein
MSLLKSLTSLCQAQSEICTFCEANIFLSSTYNCNRETVIVAQLIVKLPTSVKQEYL